jgi:hypothetical protein
VGEAAGVKHGRPQEILKVHAGDARHDLGHQPVAATGVVPKEEQEEEEEEEEQEEQQQAI